MICNYITNLADQLCIHMVEITGSWCSIWTTLDQCSRGKSVLWTLLSRWIL